MKNIIIGVIISVAFLILTFKDVGLDELTKAFTDFNYLYFIPAFIASFFIQIVRTLRWQTMLAPLSITNFKELFKISCVGFFAIGIFPMRTGEMVRPYLVTQKYHIPLTSSMAIIFLERVLDLMALLLILIISAISVELPEKVVTASTGIAGIFFFLVIMMLLMYFYTNFMLKLLSPFIKLLPDSLQIKVEELIRYFIGGFKIISEPQRLFVTVLLTFLLWFLSGLVTYSTILGHEFHNINLPFLAAYTIMFITMIGVSIPSAPGFLGTFQFACILALKEIFGAAEGEAIAFSFTYWVTAIGFTILIGLFAMRYVDFSFKEMFDRVKSGLKIKKDE